ncbi:MAG: hypothetical protein GY861_00945 [bacterium]|nr:hypothetical protein [bacterium]
MHRNSKMPAWVIKNQWKKNILRSMTNYGLMKRTECRKKIIITRIYTGRHREIDYDNFVGGCKPLLDSLKDVKFIVDDNPKWLDREYMQEKQDKNVTQVRIYDI